MPEVHVSPFGVIPKSEPGKWHLTHQHRRVAVCMTELAGLGDGAQVTNGEVVGSCGRWWPSGERGSVTPGESCSPW